MQTQSFNKSLSRLAQYRPFAHDGRDVESALRDLVLGAAAEAGGGFSSLAQCRTDIHALWGIEVEIDELREIVRRLVDGGDCLREGGGFKLSEERHQRLERDAREATVAEEAAFTAWEDAVRQLDPELTDDDLVGLRADLEAWLTAIIRRHGVESALILYPEEPRATELYRNLEELGLDFLPERSAAVRAVRDRALQLFIRQPTEAQRVYLANLLNASYFVTVLSLDSTASELVKAKIQGHRIYLDTNVLYRTLGLSRLTETLSVRRMLDLTKRLGFELAITPWTLSELQESLRRAQAQVTSRALPPRELAGLIAEETDEESFVSAYWRKYKESGVSPHDFFEFYAALETLLAEAGIKVVADGCKRVDKYRDAVDEQVLLLDRVLLREKADVVKRHDAKHRLLVENLRGAGNVRFSNARYWFLTQDSALPRYAQLSTADDKVGLPFCVSVSAWTQTVRALVPRTRDLDGALVDLLASPYIRYRGAISAQVVQEVVGRIDQYKDTNERFAAEVLMDAAFMRDVARTEDPHARTTKIDNAIVAKAGQLHVKLEAATAREIEQREALRAVEAERVSGHRALVEAHEQIRELEERLRRQAETEQRLSSGLRMAERQRAETEQQAAERVRVTDAEKRGLETQLAEHERRLDAYSAVGRWLLAGCLIACGIALPAILVTVGVVSGVWAVTAICVAAIGLVVLGLSIGFGLKEFWRILGGAAILLGLIAAVMDIAHTAIG